MNLDRTFAQINTILNAVWNGVYATVAQIGTQTIAFTPSVKLDGNYRSVHTVNGAIAYTLNEAVDNTKGKRVDHLEADGINEPTFDPTKFNIAWGNYKNEPGVKNRIYFEFGASKVDVYITYKL
tara:strand:+ start:1255 stop:1626 length:372 start_codon:yes stop_codon:yes gene_type:complete